MESLAGADIGTLARVVVGAGLGAVGFLILMAFIRRFLYICRPNQVLILSGGRHTMAGGSQVGYRVIFGGRVWRKPFIERVDALDMRTMPIDLETHQAYSKDGIPLHVRAVANVKVASDRAHIGNAIERFLGRDPMEIRAVAKETLEGTLRGVLATLTPEEVNEDRLKFAESLSDEVADDFHKLGLHLDTLKIQHVMDDVKYLDSIGRAQIAQVVRDAEIAESNANNEANKCAADSQAQGQIAREDAERVVVQGRNDQQRRTAEFSAEVASAQRKAAAAAEQARYQAELELQQIRRELEQLRLKAEIEIPAESQKRARELRARGEAARIEENGKALAQALGLIASAWAQAGPQAKDVYLIHQVEQVMGTIVQKLGALKVGEVNIIDGGDGTALPNYVAGFPATVTAVLTALRESTGIDVPQILRPDGRGALPRTTGPASSTTSRQA